LKVPLLDLRAQYKEICKEVAPAIAGVVESQQFILGLEVEKFESEIASYTGSEFGVGCASGSDALLLALMALGVSPGDEVICPSYTFFATAGSVSRLGAKPIFADINPATYNVCPESIREVAKRCSKLKALLPVHLYGQAADSNEIFNVANELGVPVIEDAAQSIGTIDESGLRVGERDSITCFSFFPSKNLGAFGDAGMVVCNNKDWAEKIQILRMHGAQPKYFHSVVGLNSRLDALQAAVLRVKLRHLDSWTEGRKRNAAVYDERLKASGAVDSSTTFPDESMFPVIVPKRASPKGNHIYNQYVVRVPSEHRDNLRAFLSRRGVGTEIYYPVPLHLQKCFSDLGGIPGQLLHAESAAKETVAIPIYPELNQSQLDYVIESIQQYFEV